MQSQAEGDLDEILDDPIVLYCDKNIDCQIVDPDIIDFGSGGADSEIDILDISQSSKSSVFERSSQSVKPIYSDNIKDLRVMIVDCDKYPWYYKRYFKRIRQLQSDSRVGGDKSGQKSISLFEKNNVVLEDYTVIRKHQMSEVEKRSLDVSSDLNLELKSDVYKTGSFEKRLEALKRREDSEIKNAISQKNLANIDFKRNLGLVGLTISQKTTVDNNIKVFNKKDVARMSKDVQWNRNGAHASVAKSNIKLSDKSLSYINFSITNISIDKDKCGPDKKSEVAQPNARDDSLKPIEPIVESKKIMCSLKIVPEKILGKFKRTNKTSNTFDMKSKIRNFCADKSSKLVCLREPASHETPDTNVNSKHTVHKNKTPVTYKITEKPILKSKNSLSIEEKFCKDGRKAKSTLGGHKRVIVNKFTSCNSPSTVTSEMTTKKAVSNPSSGSKYKTADVNQQMQNTSSNRIINKDQNVSTFNQNIHKIISDQHSPKRPRIAPISSTYTEHLNTIKSANSPSPKNFSRIANKRCESQHSCVKNHELADVHRDITFDTYTHLTNHASTNSQLPSTSTLQSKPKNQQPASQNYSKQNSLLHAILSENAQNPAKITRTTVGNKELLSTFVQKSTSNIMPAPWCQDDYNLKHRDSKQTVTSEKNTRIPTVCTDVNKNKTNFSNQNQFPGHTAIILRPQNRQANSFLKSDLQAQGHQFTRRRQMQGNNLNISPTVYSQLYGNITGPIRNQLHLQQFSHNAYGHNNFVQYEPTYDGGIPQNLVAPGISDISPNVYWPYTYPTAVPPSMPPAPIQIQPVINPNLTTVVPQINYNSIIGKNNEGVVKKINITAVPAKLNTVCDSKEVDKEGIVKIRNTNNVILKNTAETGTIKNIENCTPVATKEEMLKELDKLVETHGCPMKNNLERPFSTDNDKQNDTMSGKMTDSSKIPVLAPRPRIKAGPLSKKMKSNPPCFSKTLPDQIKTIEQPRLSKGYSPPILPIPTYEDILSQLADKHVLEPIKYDACSINSRFKRKSKSVRANIMN